MNIYKEVINGSEIIYINEDSYWQKPVITEKQIFENLFNNKIIPYNYIAFPWASYIDNIWTKKFNKLEQMINESNTDYDLEEKYNICIIPISLFPKQNNTFNLVIELQHKKYLTSFIGQIIHKNMVSNIREKIYEHFKDKQDCLIKSNDNWHYQPCVYSNYDVTKEEDVFYKQIMRESKFSLCPSGTGPNSIRLWESLSFGCIPIILSDTLCLPTISGIDYNDFCIIWKEENITSLYDYLLTIDNDKINKMSNKCIEIYNECFSENSLHRAILCYFSK